MVEIVDPLLILSTMTLAAADATPLAAPVVALIVASMLRLENTLLLNHQNKSYRISQTTEVTEKLNTRSVDVVGCVGVSSPLCGDCCCCCC